REPVKPLDLDAPDDRGTAFACILWARHAAVSLSIEPQGLGLSARNLGRAYSLRRQRVASRASGRTGPCRIQGCRASRAYRRQCLSGDRVAVLSFDLAGLWF